MGVPPSQALVEVGVAPSLVREGAVGAHPCQATGEVVGCQNQEEVEVEEVCPHLLAMVEVEEAEVGVPHLRTADQGARSVWHYWGSGSLVHLEDELHSWPT